ncbi:lipopolysaccharide biosynthesis protein [Marivivens aquimaris]|uniref:lipopolysaccharide biosynthesis protein n=1 Tax=Marivivens aquimaris TaxID=2774876 RepID=UPI00187E6EF0|nr:hypothetical protein [Marivivens aquimaris]
MIRQSFLALGLRLMAAGIAYATVMLFGRWMTPQDYGDFVIVLSGLGFGAVIVGQGYPLILLRYVHEPNGGAALSAANCRVLMMAVAAALLAAVIAPRPALAYGALLLPAFALCDISGAALRAQGKITAALAPRDISWRLALIGLAPAVGFGASDLLIAANFILWPIALAMWAAARLPRTGHAPPMQRPARRVWTTMLANAGLANLDTLCIAGVFGPEIAGLYFAAARTASLPSFALNAANMVLGPRIARAPVVTDLRKSALFGALPAFAAFLVFWVAGERILALFGERFTNMLPVLLILSLGQVVNGAAGPAGLILNLRGHEACHSRISLSAFVAAMIAVPLAALFGSPVTVAITSTAILIAYELALLRAATRKTGLSISVFSQGARG